MIVFERGPIRIAETYFGQLPDNAAVDLARCRQCNDPVRDAECEDFYSLVLDLGKEPGELFAAFHRENRRQIRKATAEGVTYQWWHPVPDRVLTEVFEAYNHFARGKRLPPANRSRLSALSRAGRLDVSRACSAEHAVLVWHVHYRSSSAVRLLHSFSHFRDRPGEAARIGRANRYNHWQDIVRFRSEGIRRYDFGGWYAGTEDKEKLTINHFKSEFGGTVVHQYNCTRAVTWKGRLALRAFKLASRMRENLRDWTRPARHSETIRTRNAGEWS